MMTRRLLLNPFLFALAVAAGSVALMSGHAPGGLTWVQVAVGLIGVLGFAAGLRRMAPQ